MPNLPATFKPVTIRRVMQTGLASLCLSSGLAFAHPHTDEPPETPKTELQSDTHVEKKIRIVRTTDSDDPHVSTDETIEAMIDRKADSMRVDIQKAQKQSNGAIKKFSESFEFDADDFLENPEKFRQAAKNLETMIADSGMISNMADILADFVDDIEFENDDDGMSLKFDGETLGRVQTKKNHNDALHLEGLGQNMTVEKEVIKENGKTKTRIIIEMDGGEDVEINRDNSTDTDMVKRLNQK